jgi:hypothetical protein
MMTTAAGEGKLYGEQGTMARRNAAAIPGERMKAVTVAPGSAGSVRLEDVPDPDAALGSVMEFAQP